MKARYYILGITLTVCALPHLVFATATTLPSTLLIDEFATRSYDSISNEYIVIANYGLIDVPLDGYTINKKAATTVAKPIFTFPKFLLASGQKVTIGGTGYTEGNFLPYNGTETLADTNNAIILNDSHGTTVDSVVYGSVTYPAIEGTSLKNPARGVPYKRIAFPEHNDNSLDFAPYIPPVPTDGNADKIAISELMPNPADGSEWFEIYNETNTRVSLAGLKICDAMGSTHCYPFDSADSIGPSEYKTYSQTQTKITLNNDGDWLELRDSSDTVLADSGGNYGVTDSGISLSLFGSEYQWTKTATPAAQNIYTDTVEVEAATLPKAATATTSKVKKAVVKGVSTVADDASDGVLAAARLAPTQLSAAKSASESTANDNSRVLGYSLIALAVALLLGYNLWEKRDDVRAFVKSHVERKS